MPKFPLHYTPRPYQAELHSAFKTHRFVVGVFPRQTGKDVAASNEQMQARLQTPKTTGVYVSLNNPMIRDILWDKTYLCPHCNSYIQGMQDQIPSGLVDWKATVMEGRFSNKSRLKLQGYFQSGQDKGGVGTSFQDYTFTELALFFREDPIPRIWPILENRLEQKRLMALSTPRGRRRNPLWQLMQSLDGNPEAKILVRTIDDLNAIMRKHGLPPVLTKPELEKIRDTYFRRFGNDRMFEQEYHCSFEEMDAATVYGEAYMAMVRERRVQLFNLRDSHPVYVVFDIGASGRHSDATAWIAFQFINGTLFIYDCGEGHGRAVPEYVDLLREKHWFNRIAWMILPWDAEHHEKAVNTTPADMMREKFSRVAVLAKSNKVYKIPGSRQGDHDLITDIQQARMQMYNTIVHGKTLSDVTDSGLLVPSGDQGNCQWLLECFENYKYEYNTKLQMWTEKPLHDKYSHMMDAFRYAVQATKELSFFGTNLYDTPGSETSSTYVEDWRGVW